MEVYDRNLKVSTIRTYPELLDIVEAENLMKEAVHFQKKTNLLCGWILTQIKDKNMFEKVGFKDFTSYLRSERFGYGKSQAYAWIKVYGTFKGESVQSLDKLESIGIAKMNQLAAVSDRELRAELIENAPDESVEELRETIKEKEVTRDIKETKRMDPVKPPELNTDEERFFKCGREFDKLIKMLTELDSWIIDLKERTAQVFKNSNEFKEKYQSNREKVVIMWKKVQEN